MSTIRIVQGSASAPTKMASYDAALADAGVENYNLVAVSSVIPADVDVEAVGTAPNLGPAGERLTVVEARATTAGPGQVSAALAWSRSADRGPGLFYEVADETDSDDVEHRVLEGLAAGQDLRDWEFGDSSVAVEHSQAEAGVYTTSLVLAVYGESEPIC
ncbi:pyruvoyl-dependent arginine decarboxylase [Natrialba magadii ATCC 43099]|uniref:arginine decarboxylase n=1 Tax=Natrialba magadii (strain ATCC 43099 / DSM 3394 / CCM 3739 / CIP 104546 / IAM 13178 / JCM 8861 / NBRC 102185 / NCIMB 2190 / MS3) TaxID=547559 RepID=D3SSZ6_NATMM|nr:pyruvoyl-dependent arginine decarboxylase [Natrialba magadii]ADD04942.1 pyruvoyl-dependent arginine decarboxylase [Natrialba magadii ATCC 43099]ELY23990.1 pyruvoyl-dependent arginine decarboxylase [Natrialba magadii ATCC 43099]